MMQSPPPTPNNIAVHPMDLVKDDWRISQQSVYSDNLIVVHAVMPPGEFEQPHLTHHCLVLHLSHSPHHLIRIDGRERGGVRGAGNFLLKPPLCPAFYAWETTDEVMAFLLTPELLKHTADQTECLNPDQIELRPVLIGQDPQIEQFAHAFHHEMKTGGLGGRLYTESLANCFVVHLLRHYCTTPAKLRTDKGGLSQQRLRRALEVIHASLDQPLRLETIADELGLDMYHFSRMFRQSMGVSPYQYVLRQRIEKAKELLKNDELSITDIALECGLANPSHLARHFRKFVGVSPRVFRRQAC